MLVNDALAYYREEVVPAITYIQTVEGGFPLPLANELRSAFTHLARAGAAPDLSGEDRVREVILAFGHLKRICLDCHKISILNRAEEIDRLTRDIANDDVALPGSLFKDIRGLRDRRMASGVQEGQSQPNGTVEELKALLKDYDDLVLKLEKDYGGDFARARKGRFWRKALTGTGFGLFLGVMASWLASGLGAFPPEQTKVTDFLKVVMRADF
jgi:hypothetical protein